jgi:hypothetical protein
MRSEQLRAIENKADGGKGAKNAKESVEAKKIYGEQNSEWWETGGQKSTMRTRHKKWAEDRKWAEDGG